MAYAPYVIAAVGTAVSVAGAMQQADQAKKSAEYNAALARRNAEINDQNAAMARRQATLDSEAQRRESARQLGAMRAGYATSGLQMEGSPLDVMAASVQQSELDTMNTIYKGEMRALSFENESTGLGLSAQLDSSRASAASRQGMYSAGSSLLSGASQSYGAYSASSSSIRDYGSDNQSTREALF